MYSTYSGAKARANKLHKIFQNCGFVFPLHKSQHAIAYAGGFQSWHELSRVLKSQNRECNAKAFRHRLLATLPKPCHAPTRAWLDGEPKDEAINSITPPGWYRYVFPYQFATAARHRHSPSIKRGSGPGQKLRENMVVGILLNHSGGLYPYPRFEPETLAFVFEGKLEDIFDRDFHHARFERELEALQEAGVIERHRNQVIIHSPDREYIHEKVISNQINKVSDWAGEPEHMKEIQDALHKALAAIGIDDALNVSKKLLEYGSDGYIHRSGPIQEVLSELAVNGDIGGFSRFFGLSCAIWPKDADHLRKLVPAKILNQHFAKNVANANSISLVKFTQDNPDWATDLKSAIASPVKFERTVDEMSQQIMLSG